MEQIPTTYLGLFGALMLGILGLLTWVVKSVLGTTKGTQAVLANHFAHDLEALGEIKGHMAAQNELGRLIVDELRKRPLDDSAVKE